MLGTLFPLINLFIVLLKCIDNEYTKKTSLERYLYHVGSFKYIIVDSYFFLGIYLLFLKGACGRISVPGRIVSGNVIRW